MTTLYVLFGHGEIYPTQSYKYIPPIIGRAGRLNDCGNVYTCQDGVICKDGEATASSYVVLNKSAPLIVSTCVPSMGGTDPYLNLWFAKQKHYEQTVLKPFFVCTPDGLHDTYKRYITESAMYIKLFDVIMRIDNNGTRTYDTMFVDGDVMVTVDVAFDQHITDEQYVAVTKWEAAQGKERDDMKFYYLKPDGTFTVTAIYSNHKCYCYMDNGHIAVVTTEGVTYCKRFIVNNACLVVSFNDAFLYNAPNDDPGYMFLDQRDRRRQERMRNRVMLRREMERKRLLR